MKLGDTKGIKTSQWFPNEIMHRDDLDAVGKNTYQNFTDILSTLADQGVASGSSPDRVLGGLLLEWSSVLTSNLRAGMAVSYSGYYMSSSGAWGFVAIAGEIFSIVVEEDNAVVVGAGDGGDDRIDTVEARPIEVTYNSTSRQFKDPITGVVTSAITKTKKHYSYEVQVLAGTPAGSPVAPSKTAGWIKIAEVYVAQSASSIDQDDIKDVRNSDTWTTEASGTKYKELAAIDVSLVDASGLYDASEVEGALAEIGGLKKFTEVTGDITVAKNTRYLVTGSHDLTLPTSGISVGDAIEIAVSLETPSAGYAYLKQNDAQHLVKHKKYYTTKGTAGQVKLLPGDRILLTYIGSSLNWIEPWTKLTDPAAPVSTANDVAWSRDAVYLAVTHGTSPYVTIYKRTGDTFAKLGNPATLPAGGGNGCDFFQDSSGNDYLAVANAGDPRMTVYKRSSGDTFVKLSDPASPPGSTTYDCKFSPDGNYLAYIGLSTPYMWIYSRSGDTFTKVADPATLPGGTLNSCVWSPDSNYVILGRGVSPWAYAYKHRGSDVFFRLPDFSPLPDQAIYGMTFKPDGSGLIMGVGNTTTKFHGYDKRGATFTEQNPDLELPASISGSDAEFSHDGKYMVTGFNQSPFMAIFRVLDDNYFLIANPASVPGSTVSDVAMSYDGAYFACAHGITPFVYVARARETVTKAWAITKFNGQFLSESNLDVRFE